MGWLIAVIVLILLFTAFRLARLATRLDRLHRRTEAAWAALDVALARRSGVARALSAAPGLEPKVAAAVATAARLVDSAPRDQRPDAENELTKALEMVPTNPESNLPNELVEVAQRILLARRFYNDAVRDTRSLRADRFSRMFRLAGRAGLPEYFEIAEYNPEEPLTRVSARVLLLDQADRVLLLSGADPETSTAHFWFTPGGGVESGEDLISAARRELYEETGVRLRPSALIGPLWWRRSRFRFTGIEYEQTEYYFVTRPFLDESAASELPDAGLTDAGLTDAGFTDVERSYITGRAWWSAADLRSTSDVVYPLELAARLPEAVAVSRSGEPPGEPVQIE